jgi:hypothetical protein
VVNPFGIVYNPLCISAAVKRLVREETYTLADLECSTTANEGTTYYSFDHHTRFSSPDPETTVSQMNAELVEAAAAIRQASVLFLTFGSAFTYSLPSNNRVVANCHRLPNSKFTKNLATASTISVAVSSAIEGAKALNPDLQVILTVSPVRHWREGASQNIRSKATLLVAAHDLTDMHPEWVHYFPSYEIMLDDLRDYRFYEEDMLHPSTLAVDYIWEKLSSFMLHKNTTTPISDFKALHLALCHRPTLGHDQIPSPPDQAFARKQLVKLEELGRKYPYVDLELERAHFAAMCPPTAI